MISKTFSEVLEVILTEDEIKQRSEENNKKILERARMKAEAKRYADGFGSKIKTMDLEIEDTAKLIADGKEFRSVECKWMPEIDTHEMRAVRLDTYGTLRRRPMDGDERREYLQNKLFDQTSPAPGADRETSNENAVSEFFDEIKSNVVTPDEIPSDHPSVSEILADEDDGGTPFPTEYDQATINEFASYYCADKIAQGKPVTLCYILDQPHVITEFAHGDGENYSNVVAWSVLPLENMTKEEATELRKKGQSYLGQEIKVGPNTWVIVGEQKIFSVKEDNFTADRCDECKMIDGGHASTCSQSNAPTYDDYLEYAKATKKTNPRSYARKAELNRYPDIDAKVKEWKQENAPNGRAAKAEV